jgi:endonuclease/exonuclease/phosphatase family metal-dependent hydrolase
MKLIQLNIWQGRFIDQITQWLQQEQPDILCMQEVYSCQPIIELLPFFSSLERITAAFPTYHVFFSPAHTMSVAGSDVTMGNVILSRYPLEDTETFFISERYVRWNTEDEYVPNIRNLQRATVRLGKDQAFTLMNHHGYWEPTPMGSETTVVKTKQVAAIVAESSQPLILAGDLNISADSPAMKPLHALLRDLTQEYKLRTTLSSFGKVKDVPCDHICVSEGVEVREFAAGKALISDHLPLLMHFDIAR